MHAYGCACLGCGYARSMGAIDPALLQQGIQSTTEIASAILAARAQRKAQEAAAASASMASMAPSWSPAPTVAAPAPVASSSPLTPLAVFAGGLLVVLAGGVFLVRSRRGR